jgi:alpha-galactosidase
MDPAVLVHWRSGGVSLVIDRTGGGLPRVLHWGADLGELSDPELAALANASVPPVVTNSIDQPVPVSVLP